MISSISSNDNMFSLSKLQEKMFLKADKNVDGKIDTSEMSAMQANAPQDAPRSDDIFTKLDTDQDGSINRAESDAAIAKMFYEMAQNGSGLSSSTSAAISSTSSHASQRLTDLFSKIDSDGDGSVSKEEFLSNRPEDVSEDRATEMWSRLDPSGNGSMTQSQFVSAMENQGPHQGPPPGGVGGPEDNSVTFSTSASSTSSRATANSELVQALLAAIKQYTSTMGQSESSSAVTSAATGSLSVEA